MSESDGTEVKKIADYVTDLWSFLRQKQLLIIYIFGYIVSMVAANITFKMEANAFINYPMFTTWLNIVLMTPLFLIPTVYGLITGSTSKEARDVPFWKFILVGLFDIIAWSIEFIGADMLGPKAGALQVMIGQTLIPLSLALSVGLLGRKYHLWQYEGALVVFGGVFMALIPQIQKMIANKTDVSTLATLIFASSMLPLAFSAATREWILRDCPSMPVNHFAFLENLVALVFSVGTLFIPVHGRDRILDDITDGFKCLGGINSQAGDACPNAWWQTLLFITFGTIGFGIGVGLVKEGSVPLFFLLKAVNLPIVTFFFSLHWVMGENAQPITLYTLIGLIVIVFGMLCYAYGGFKLDQQPKPEELEDPPKYQETTPILEIN